MSEVELTSLPSRRTAENRENDEERDLGPPAKCLSFGTRPKTYENRFSWFSQLTFWYLNPMISAGRKKALEEDSLPELMEDDLTKIESDILVRLWAQYRKKVDNPKILDVMKRAYGWWFWKAGFWKFPQDCLIFVTPLVLKQLILFCQEPEPSWMIGMVMVGILFISAVIQSLCLHQYFHSVYRLSMHLRAGLCAMVYQKSLRLSASSRGEMTAGEMVNLMSTDATRVMDCVPYLHNLLWSAQLQILASMFLLYQLVGYAAFAGLVAMVLIIPLNGFVMKTVKKVQESNMGFKDNRIKTVKEALQGMRIIKFFTWENPITEKVKGFRNQEMQALKKFSVLSTFQSVFWNSAPVFVSVVIFGVFAYTGGELTLEIVFPALSLINIMRFPLNIIPYVYSSLVSARVSVKRIGKFLALPEQESYVLPPIRNIQGGGQKSQISLQIDDGSFEWVEGAIVLRDINLAIPKGTLCAVVGSIGSGKSSLIAAILGEIIKIKGQVRCERSVGYVAQQAWIQNATVRDNILGGLPYEKQRYDQTVHCCALERDFELLQDGDSTEIGEGGINLSGGQKQRISMARAVYADAEIYLLDDPLSAVDAHVGNHILKECILTVLKTKTVILVTHRLDILPKMDMIVVLRDGRIEAKGSLEECAVHSSLVRSSISPVSDGMETIFQKDSTPEDPSSLTSPSAAAIAASASASPLSSSSSIATPKSKSANQPTKLIQAEARAEGSVKAKVYKSYVIAMGLMSVIFILVVGLVGQGVRLGTDWWLSYWASTGQESQGQISYFLSLYAVWTVGQALIIAIRDIALAFCQLQAATTLHNNMFASIMRAPMSFFDTTPSGRIINRFSSDQSVVDEALPRTLNSLMGTLLFVVGTVIAVSFITPTFIVGLAPLVWLYSRIQEYYRHTARELKRTESLARSPVLSHFSESLAGVVTIRAFGSASKFVEHNLRLLDRLNRVYLPNAAANRWLGIRVEFCGNGIGTFASLSAVIFACLGWLNGGRASLVGLALTFAFGVTNTLGWSVRMLSEAEAYMNSVERVVEYGTLPAEAAFESTPENKPPATWPTRGSVTFDKVALRYREGLNLVLEDASFEIIGGQKIGVCGRTASGKTTLIAALFRIVELASGKITIDGVDVSKIGLHDLRAHISIVPQDPVLFTGTVRFNIDPFNQYTDDEIWAIIDRVHLRTQIEKLPEKLNAPVTENGSNFSVGERQLFCMGRALLKSARVIVMDEATASADIETDALIQKAIRTACTGCTVITIAHRINTIMDYDQILVMEAGHVAEFAPPQDLIQQPNSMFGALVRESQQQH